MLKADRTCHLAITWTRTTETCPSELCVVMTNLHLTGWVLRRYLRRMHVEESVRDDTSGSFDLHTSHLADPERRDTLLLAIAGAVLWIYQLGEQLLCDECRKGIDPPYQRQPSVFRLDGQLLHRLASCAKPSACTLQLRLFRPEPVWRGTC
jgi:hypothetical protein